MRHVLLRALADRLDMTLRPATVFVVDDDASVRQAVGALLRSVGYQPKFFGSAQEFLASAKVDGPACLILDVRMAGVPGLGCQRRQAEAGISSSSNRTPETTRFVHRIAAFG